MENPRPARESPNISAVAKAAETQAAMASPGMPPTAKLKPAFMYKAAPTAAPAEMPRVYGVASGLRNTACKATPPTASTAPLKNPRHTRGSRIRHRMSASTLPGTP